MAEKYLTTQDRNMRLNRTICMYKNKPVYVVCSNYEVVDERHVLIYSLKEYNRGTQPTTIDYTSSDFCDRAFRLGYLTIKGTAYYLTRVPQRRQSQGLHEGAVNGKPFKVPGWFTSPEMENCILGKHDSFEEAWNAIQQGGHSHSFHRYLALERMDRDRLFLKFRDRTIGWQKDRYSKVFSVFIGRDNRIISSLLDENNVQYRIE